MSTQTGNQKSLEAENKELREQLSEAQETLHAIQNGEVDALVVSTPEGMKTYTLTGAEKPYRILIEQMKEGAVMLGENNSILYCNSGFAETVKIPLDKLIGSSMEALIPPAQMMDFEHLVARGRRDEGSIAKEISLLTGKGGFVPTHISANTLRADGSKTTFLVITDLTEHMEAEVKRYTAELEHAQTRLYDSEQRWATTLASVGDAVIATDTSSRITFMNKVAEGLTGWNLKDAAGKSVDQVFDILNGNTRQPVESPVAKVLEKGEIVSLAINTILRKKDGKEVWVDDSGAPIQNKEGKLDGVVLIFRDITLRRQLQAQLEDYAKNLEKLVKERTKQLRTSERLAAIGATAGMVGHDIRNPLQSITGDVYLIKTDLASMSEGEEKQSVKESLESIEKNVDYINKIVQDLQDYTKPIVPTFEQVDFEALCKESVFEGRIPKTVTATCKVSNNAKKAFLDINLLKRILANLISNAVQAMPQGGKLDLCVFRKADSLVITVSDTGVGIPEAVRPKIFTPLFTTKSKGQGFGLPVVKRMTEALGGTVTFESTVGKGTTFTLKFPISKETTKA